MSNADLIALTEAIDALDKDDYAMGPSWKVAHRIAMEHEGKAVYDRLHALLHRIEGDTRNADYWYDQAGTQPFEGDFQAEAKALLAALG